MTLRSIALVICVFLTGCHPDTGSTSFRGAGVQLNAQRANASSRNMASYIDTMCANAGLASTNGRCPPRLDSDSYNILLEAGLGEINLGCRSYVQYIFERRSRDEQYRSSTSAVQAFLSGIFTIEGGGARLFSYLILGSTAANSFYDISAIDPLRGMTPSNILRIVTERQKAFETALIGKKITSTPQLFRTWHEYQWLCSPLSISSDFNELAVAAIDGRKVDFKRDAEEMANQITRSIDNVRTLDPNKGVTPAPTNPVPNAVGPVEKGLLQNKVDVLQAALCLKQNGTLDQITRDAINYWRRSVTPTAQATEGLSSNELNYLLTEGSCSQLGYRSGYERALFYDSPFFAPNATAAEIAKARNSRFSDFAKRLKLVTVEGDIKFSTQIRAAITEKQKEFNLRPSGIVDETFYLALLKSGVGP